jgi:hypothetical protein
MEVLLDVDRKCVQRFRSHDLSDEPPRIKAPAGDM